LIDSTQVISQLCLVFINVLTCVTCINISKVWCKKNVCFSNNCNFVYFQYKKNYVNTKTTCNKSSFDYLHRLLNYRKLYQKDGVPISYVHYPSLLVSGEVLRGWHTVLFCEDQRNIPLKTVMFLQVSLSIPSLHNVFFTIQWSLWELSAVFICWILFVYVYDCLIVNIYLP
jgi:hypothetical protein